MDHVVVLIHSPLVGPLTWALVAADLRRRGIATVVPELHDTEGAQLPYWRQHVASVQSALEGVPMEQSLVLVGHSGAGPLLPLIGQPAPRRVSAYIFVDAALPLNGMSRLSDMAANAPEFATPLRQHLESGGRYPTWSEDDLRAIIPDERLRQAIVAELRPRPRAFFAEPLPGFAGRPAAPCGYLEFSAPYAAAAAWARRAGWGYRAIAAGHFHMLVDPVAVTAALLDLVPALLPL